jgi:hypothetical protein
LSVVGKVRKADFTPGASTDVAQIRMRSVCSVGEGGIGVKACGRWKRLSMPARP